MIYSDVLRLVLYVTGDTTRSAEAIANLQEIQKLLNGHCEITVIDVLEFPALAEKDRVLATPTLIKLSPPPARRLIGDLSDQAMVISLLDLGGGLSMQSQTKRR